MLPASFNGARSPLREHRRESGRRIVEHQFPKKDLPYAEDMGRSAREFTVRGYCIVFPFDTGDGLRTIDYTVVRDLLIAALEAEGPGHAAAADATVAASGLSPLQGQRGRAVRRVLHHRHDISGIRPDPLLTAPSVATAAAVSDNAAEVEKSGA